MTIDPKLKEAIIDKTKLSLRELADDPGLKVKLEKQGQKVSLSGDRKCPKNALLVLVERKLRKQRIWKALRLDLVSVGLWEVIHEFQRKQTADASKVELSAARERQLELFPGFESLPIRIRKGNNFLKFHEAPVTEFLLYADKYELRSQRNQKTADELKRMAGMVRPYAELEMTMEKAFDRARMEQAAPALKVVK